MIYLDNAATTLHKPPEVEQAMMDALRTAGNPGRGAHEPTLHASRIVFQARCAMAKLLNVPDPSCIAFTSNATQALNLAISGLFGPGDHIITTVCEHNSVLRPLYRLREQGTRLDFIETDAEGRFCDTQWDEYLRPDTRAFVLTMASNVTGNEPDLAQAARTAHRNGMLLVVDASQTAGAQPIDVQAMGIDVLCFTGHKALLGPQGTGGIYVRPGLALRPLIVGGSGVQSFLEHHPTQMPTALEAGTLNVPGLAGLCAGAEWLLAQGIENLQKKETALTELFYENVRTIPNAKIYGDPLAKRHAPIVSLNIGGLCPDRESSVGRLRHLRACRCSLRAADAQSTGNRRAGCGAVQLFAFQHRAGGSAGGTGRAGTGTGGLNESTTDLYRSFVPYDHGSHGMGKAMHGTAGAGQADPAPAGDLGGLRPCMADAAGRVRTLAASAGQNRIRQGRSGRTIKAGE